MIVEEVDDLLQPLNCFFFLLVGELLGRHLHRLLLQFKHFLLGQLKEFALLLSHLRVHLLAKQQTFALFFQRAELVLVQDLLRQQVLPL